MQWVTHILASSGGTLSLFTVRLTPILVGVELFQLLLVLMYIEICSYPNPWRPGHFFDGHR